MLLMMMILFIELNVFIIIFMDFYGVIINGIDVNGDILFNIGIICI